MTAMSIKILPALQDNYMYLVILMIIDKTKSDNNTETSKQIIDNETKAAAIVDPVNPDSVIQAVKDEGVNLLSVLTTHHHWDHAGGNEQLVKKFERGSELKVYGGDERIGALTDKVIQDDKLTIGNLSVRCIFTPCHTSGHICYFVEAANGDKAVFTGNLLC